MLTGRGALPRLVATDLDGTLLRSDGSASPRTVAAVRAVEAAGIAFVVATARPPRWMHELLPVVGERGIAICSNGAFVYDVARRSVTAEQTIARDVLLEVVADLRREIPDIAFAVETTAGYGREAAYSSQHPEPDELAIGELADLIDPLPGKLLARSADLDGDRFVDSVARVIGERAIVAFSGSAGLAEISAAGVTKAAVLAEWCDDLGIAASDVWAFGDMPNDLPMLAFAGRAFAVANAHPDVLAAADSVCGSNDDDGVAEVLEQIVQQSRVRP
jgi:HAD superfamily hydrolase (TIGR01484 family)